MSKKNKADKAAQAGREGNAVRAGKDVKEAGPKDRGTKAVGAGDRRGSPVDKALPVAAGQKQEQQDRKADGKPGLDGRQITLISKALADPKRMAIFRKIAQGDAMCGDIKSCIAVSAATLSHHMKELETAGLIETSREGRFMRAALRKKVWKNYLGELKAFVG